MTLFDALADRMSAPTLPAVNIDPPAMLWAVLILLSLGQVLLFWLLVTRNKDA